MNDIAGVIEDAFEQRFDMTPENVDPTVRSAIEAAVAALDSGEARVAEKRDGEWVVNEWLKKAVLLSFRVADNRVMAGGFTQYFDKVAMKFTDTNKQQMAEAGVRVVPPACARKGAYIAPGVVLMPS